jgi:hypothetical protein
LVGQDINLKEIQKELKDGAKGKGKAKAKAKKPAAAALLENKPKPPGKSKAKAKAKAAAKESISGKVGKEYIVGSVDETDDSKFGTEITIELRPDAYEQITADYKARGELPIMDAVEEYLELYNQMPMQLNMIDLEGFVQSFDSYEEILVAWFIERRKLYEERVIRMRVLWELRCRYYRSVIRYIEMSGKPKDGSPPQLSLDEIPKEEGCRLLESLKFEKYNTGPLLNRTYARSEKLQELILGSDKADYEYIYELSGNNRSAEGKRKFAESLAEVEAKLEDAKKNDWTTIWLRELDEVEVAVKDRVSKRWAASDRKFKFKTVDTRGEAECDENGVAQ